MFHEIIPKDKPRIHVFTSNQTSNGGGTRNCMDWILDAYAAGATAIVIYMPYASDKLASKVQKYGDKITDKLHIKHPRVVRTPMEYKRVINSYR